jgi:hypothetical protein
MQKSITALLFLVALMLTPLAGCFTTKDDTTHNLFTGEHSQLVSGTPDQVIAAAREVVHDMNYTEVSSSATKTTGHLAATTPTETTVEFDAEWSAERVTKLTVRVGTGDRNLSSQLIEKIRAKL